MTEQQVLDYLAFYVLRHYGETLNYHIARNALLDWSEKQQQP